MLFSALPSSKSVMSCWKEGLIVKERLIEKFSASGENGRKYTVLVYQESVDTSSTEGQSSLDTMQSCRLSNGEPLNYIDKNTYKTVMGETLTRCD